ncbi:MAG: hypothetical protein ACRD20_13335 [Terriglobales bacterium]
MERSLENRIGDLERRLALVENIFRTATGFDPDLDADTKTVAGLISAHPGMSQAGIVRLARHSAGLTKTRVIELLRQGAGRLWRIEWGAFNSLLHFPLAEGMRADKRAASELTEANLSSGAIGDSVCNTGRTS